MKKCYRILERRRLISGVEHVLVERDDGFQFYLDPAFLAVLETLESGDLDAVTTHFSIENEELDPLIRMLEGAGLIDRSMNA